MRAANRDRWLPLQKFQAGRTLLRIRTFKFKDRLLWSAE